MNSDPACVTHGSAALASSVACPDALVGHNNGHGGPRYDALVLDLVVG
jgi:hypothetical protein